MATQLVRRGSHIDRVVGALRANPVVGILGPRQIGKTTLARQVTEEYPEPCHHLDLEDPRDLDRLTRDPKLVLEDLGGLVVIDEVQRCPDLFPVLRVLSDRPALPARFLVLGSASPDLLRQSSESLAGRIHYHELRGFSLAEAGRDNLRRRWLRGGFPRAVLARADADGFAWLADFVRTFLERDLGGLGFRGSTNHMYRFWAMLAHRSGQTWNGARLANSLDRSDKTLRSHLDFLTGALVVRQLPAWTANMGKRQVKAPRVYLRDTGILHSLLGVEEMSALQRHPSLGASWEGFGLEAVIDALDLDARRIFFWRTHNGAELDLFLPLGTRRLGFEFKHTSAPKVTPSMHIALQDLEIDDLVVVYPGEDSYPLGERVRAVGIGTDDLEAALRGPMSGRSGRKPGSMVRVHSAGQALRGVRVMALFPNGTYKSASTDGSGRARLQLYRNDLPMTLLVAAAGFRGGVVRGWVPQQGEAVIEVEPLPRGGSIAFPLGTGRVPGLAGRLRAFRDEGGQPRIYADNVAVNGGHRQPVAFRLDEDMHLMDAEGGERRVRVREIVGRAALIDYEL